MLGCENIVWKILDIARRWVCISMALWSWATVTPHRFLEERDAIRHGVKKTSESTR